LEERGGDLEGWSVVLSNPAQGKNGKQGEENKPCVLSVTLGGAPPYGSGSQDQWGPIGWEGFVIGSTHPIHTDSCFTTSRAVLSVAVQVFITDGWVGPRTIAVFSNAACSIIADSAISGAISVLCALHFDACGVKLTPLVSCEIEPGSTVTPCYDGFTDGSFSTVVMATA